MNKTTKIFWENFLNHLHLDKNTKYSDIFYFGSHESSANFLLELVLNGQKKATCSSLASFELKNESVPKEGEYCIITDWKGNPRGVIKTTNVLRMTFEDMTFDICKREGEDEDLKSWQENHIYFFESEGKQLGYKFDWKMDIIFEDFELVYSESK